MLILQKKQISIKETYKQSESFTKIKTARTTEKQGSNLTVEMTWGETATRTYKIYGKVR